MTATLAPKDFASDQEVRWCPGCGDYAILKAVQKTLADVGATTERTVFVSGIGCSSRFPYYVATYGFHTIHGRAPAVATGVKLANPELDVWLVTGDGDGLSIGGNHLLHVLRRNVDLQIILFNNEIYGLTKGQYSPTSRRGTHSPSTPSGSLDSPVSPCAFALGAGARFVARAVDTQQAPLVDVLKRAHAHHGASFVEVFQNCVVYNDGVFDAFTEKSVAAEQQLHVVHGQPLRFGKDQPRGLRLVPGKTNVYVGEPFPVDVRLYYAVRGEQLQLPRGNRAPTEVESSQGPHHPNIERKGVPKSIREKQHTIGNLSAYSGQRHEPAPGLG